MIDGVGELIIKLMYISIQEWNIKKLDNTLKILKKQQLLLIHNLI